MVDKLVEADSTPLILTDSLHKIRTLVNDKDINNQIQDKQFFKLAEAMATISRNANICAGIFFNMHLSTNVGKEAFEQVHLRGHSEDTSVQAKDADSGGVSS